VRFLMLAVHARRLAALALALLVVPWVSCQSTPSSNGGAPPSGSPAATRSSPVASARAALSGDYLLFNDRGRGELVIADTSGTEVLHVASAGVSATPRVAIDPSGRRVAYWRQAPGGFELALWDSGSPTVRVIATESELMPWATPVWTEDGDSIVTTVAAAPSAAPPGAPPARGRLEIRSASGGAARTLAMFASEHPIVALFADQDIAAGFRARSTNMTYVVVDAKTGSVRTEVPASTFLFSGFGTQGRMSWGVIGEFESTKPATLRVWPVDDYGREAARFDVVGPGIPLAWPRRTEIAFTSVSPGRYEIRALDYAKRSSRTVGTVGLGASPLGFSSDGSSLLLSKSSFSEYDVVRIMADGTLGPIRPYRVTGRPDNPTFQFLGWLRL
jgi:hypothetical protein